MKFLKGGGEMGELIRSKDWKNSSIGSIENWSPSLRTTLSIILNSKFPMFLFWGPDLTCFYNDAYRTILGTNGKHPIMLGGRAEDFWQEVWGDIKPLIDSVLGGGEASWSEDQLLPIFRNGRMEDVCWTFSFSAVNDEHGDACGVFVTCVETTKQVFTLKEFEDNQELLKFSIDATNLGTWNLNLKTNRFSYNETLREWFGLNYEYEINAKDALQNIVEEDRQRTSDAMDSATMSGSDGIYEIEHTVVNPLDGKRRVILAKGKALFDKNGVAYRFSGTGQDITKEVFYRKKDNEQNLLNKTILESNPDCVKIINIDGMISYMNENGVHVLEGDNKNDFMNRKWETMWGADEEIIVHNAIERAFLGEKINFQASAITIKGNLKWWDVIIAGLPDETGAIKELLAVSRDISGIKKAEKDLEESEEQLRFALDGGNLGYFNSYPQQGIINWSDKTKEFFGLSPEAKVNLEVYRSVIHPDDVERALNQLNQALIDGEESMYENEYRTANTNKWLSVRGKIKPGKENQSVRITGIIQDITESKSAQKLLLDSEHRFRNMIHTSPSLISILKGDNFIVDIANDAIIEAWGKGSDVIGKPLLEVLPEIAEQGFGEILNQVYKTGVPFRAFEMPVNLIINGILELRYFNFVYQAQRDVDGEIESIAILSTDVTQQAELNIKVKENEKLLFEAKEQLELTFANVPAAIFLYNNEKEILFANERAANMLGYETTVELLSHQNFDILMQKAGLDFFVVNENNEPITRKNLPTTDALKTGEVAEVVFSMQKKSGGAINWYLNKSAPIFDADGKVTMVLTTSTDITAQKIAEETIRDSESHFRLLTDNAPMWVFITDLEINILYANQAILKYIGLNHYSEFTGKVWQQVVHPEDVVIVSENFQNALVEQSNFDFEIRVLNAKTQLYEWFYYKGISRYENEKFIGFIGTAININEQKTFSQTLETVVEKRTAELEIVNKTLIERNDELSQSESFNRNLINLSPNIVYIHDFETSSPVFFNQAGLDLVGTTWEEIQAHGSEIRPMTAHPDDYQSLNENHQKVKNSKNNEAFEHEFRIKNAQGGWSTILSKETSFKRNDKNEVTQLLGVGVDITEIKKSKNNLEQKNEELVKMNKELESFAYVSSHDLQEPLRKIQTFTSRIMDKEYDNLSEIGQNYLNRMGLAAERMQQLINDLLAYSRTKVQERKFENTDLSLIVKEVEDDLKDELEKKNGHIEIGESCKADVILFQFRQLIYNLVSNSIKFAKSNEDLVIKVKFEVIKGIEASNDRLMTDKEYCHISIADNGIGFESSYKDRIFEIFQRLHGREEYTGTGIGLAIVKKIVDNHNGLITANGELNKGATFDIYIPVG